MRLPALHLVPGPLGFDTWSASCIGGNKIACFLIAFALHMVTKVYAHILDEDRKVNAQKFESAFYANPDLRGVQAPAEPAPALDVQSIILQLQQSPELLSALTSLISNQGCK